MAERIVDLEEQISDYVNKQRANATDLEGRETPSGAQAKVDAHKALANPHATTAADVGADTSAQVTAKADSARDQAKAYTDAEVDAAVKAGAVQVVGDYDPARAYAQLEAVFHPGTGATWYANTATVAGEEPGVSPKWNRYTEGINKATADADFLHVKEGPLSIERRGAVADGVTDNGPAITQAAIDVAAAGSGAVLIPPTADPFLIGSTAMVEASDVGIVGLGPGSQVARLAGFNLAHLIHIRGAVAAGGGTENYVRRNFIQNVTIGGNGVYGGGTASIDNAMIKVERAVDWRIDGWIRQNAGPAIWTDEAFIGTINAIIESANAPAGVCLGNTANYISVLGRIVACSSHGVTWTGATALAIRIDADIEGNNGASVLVPGTVNLRGLICDGLYIEKVYFNGRASTSIAAGSNGLSLPQSEIHVADTSAFPSAGKLILGIGVEPLISYTGKTATSFTGCTVEVAGSKVMSTGNAVWSVVGSPIKFEEPTVEGAQVSGFHMVGAKIAGEHSVHAVELASSTINSVIGPNAYEHFKVDNAPIVKAPDSDRALAARGVFLHPEQNRGPRAVGRPRLHDRGLWLPKLTTDYLSTPDKAALRVTGDLDVRCFVTPGDYVGEQTLMARYGGTAAGASWILQLSAKTVRLIVQNSITGLGVTFTGPNVPDTAHNLEGAPLWIRATLDVDNGAGGSEVKFYVSEGGQTWRQIGATAVHGAVIAVNAGTEALAVGRRSSAASPLGGKVFAAEMRSGIGGAVVAAVDLRVPFSGKYRDDQGNVWTLFGADWAWARPEAA